MINHKPQPSHPMCGLSIEIARCLEAIKKSNAAFNCIKDTLSGDDLLADDILEKVNNAIDANNEILSSIQEFDA